MDTTTVVKTTSKKKKSAKKAAPISSPLTQKEVYVQTTLPEPMFEAPAQYVVVRNDQRVSDEVYPSDKDPNALEEKKYWERIVNKWSPGEKVKVVKL
jgi:hypothetical protein